MATRYWVGGSGNWDLTTTTNWSATSGGAGGASAPSVTDIVIFNSASSSGSYTVTIDPTNGGSFGSLTIGGPATGSVSFAAGGNYLVSNLNNGSVTIAATGVTSPSNISLSVTTSAGTFTVTTNGVSIVLLSVDCTSSTLSLGSALTLTAGVVHGRGTFLTNNYSITAASFSASLASTAGYVSTLTFGSSAINLTAGFNLTAAGTYLTLTSNTATITMTSSTAKSFTGGGKSFYSLINSGAGILTINGSNTFDTVSNATQPTTFNFTSGTTQTVTNFNVSGTSGNLVTIKSSTAASAATLSKSSGTVSSNYLSIQDSTATGGASWYAGANSTNVSGNTGWLFSTAPSSNFFLVM
jgi:hypothetical protein